MRLCNQCRAGIEDGDRFCAACGAVVRENDSSGSNDPLVGRIVGGSYVLQEIVGVGGMGRVYRAEQSTLGRTVAVKVIHPHLLSDDQTVARFYQEARASSQLNHPNSVSVIDFGRTEEGILYLAMEFLTGKDLAMILYEEGPLPFDRICRILIGALDALGEAHALGIVHRDLKPENVILRPLSSGEDLVKLVDFGLATILGRESSITNPGLVCGTPDYMSPEQGRGDPVDGRGDLYALGVLLFELLTGRLPYIDDTPTRVVLRHLNDPIPDPRTVAPDREIPNALAEITIKALSKKADERFQTAREMQTALRAVLGGFRQDRSASMSCPQCAAVNPATAKFCGECGGRLGWVASEAPRSLRPSFRPPLGSQQTFIGREAELASMDEYRDAALSGALWVHTHGDVGVGKTRFLAEVADRFAARGDLVIGAGPHPTGAAVPYFPIIALLTELLDTERGALAEAIDDGRFQDALACAGVAEVLEPQGVIGGDGQPRTGAVACALALAIEQARSRSNSGLLVLVVDDLPRCDGLSQQVVAELTRACATSPLLILTSGEHDRIDETEESIQLTRFDRDLASTFLNSSGHGEAINALFSEELAQETFSPLYLEHLGALGVGPRSVAPPTKLADAIIQRTERLSVEARNLLQAAAVLGTTSDYDMLAALAEQDDLAGLKELVEEAFVQAEEERLHIVHPFVSELLEAAIPAGARRTLHQKAFALLAAHGAPLEVRAEHAFRGGEAMTSMVVLEQAGELALRRGDGPGAVRSFQRALELSRREVLETGDTVMDAAMATFSRKLGQALARAGEPAGADGVLREALELTAYQSPERARMLLALGEVAALRDRPRDAMRHFGRALELVAGVDAEVESRVQVAIGRVRRIEGDTTHAANAYRRALELFAQTNGSAGSRIMATRARLELAEALLAMNEPTKASDELAQIETDARQIGAVALLARATGIRGSLEELQGRREQAKELYEQAEELAAEAGDAPGQRRWRSAGRTLAT